MLVFGVVVLVVPLVASRCRVVASTLTVGVLGSAADASGPPAGVLLVLLLLWSCCSSVSTLLLDGDRLSWGLLLGFGCAGCRLVTSVGTRNTSAGGLAGRLPSWQSLKHVWLRPRKALEVVSLEEGSAAGCCAWTPAAAAA